MAGEMYPKREPWRSWPQELQIAFLEQRVRTEQETVERVTGHWLRAAARVKELEARGTGLLPAHPGGER